MLLKNRPIMRENRSSTGIRLRVLLGLAVRKLMTTSVNGRRRLGRPAAISPREDVKHVTSFVKHGSMTPKAERGS
jgi:hypothetical protein